MLRTGQRPRDWEINRHHQGCGRFSTSSCNPLSANKSCGTDVPAAPVESHKVERGEQEEKTVDSSYKLYKCLALKNYFNTSNIKSFVCSAITLSVISTLKLFEVVTDGKESMPSLPAGVHLS